MARIGRLLAILLATAATGATQDDSSSQWGGGNNYGPKKKSDCWNNGKPKPWEGYNKGVKWTQTIDDAFKKAKEDGKILMVFHLVGDMDKEGCWAAGHVMRTVTFSDEKVAKLVNDNFVSTWINRNPKFHNCELDTERRIVENSFECYSTKNFCTFFVTPEQEVLHYFAGYFSPGMFKKELEFVQELAKEVCDEKTGCLKKGALAKYRDIHRKHAAEHQATEAKLKEAKPPTAGGEGWEEFKKNADGWRQRFQNLKEGVCYLAKVHGALEKTTSKSGAPAKLASVLKNYLGGNEFTEE